jgi:hypothetical protein
MMSFNVCYVKNIDTVTHTYSGQEITAGSYYQIQDGERAKWMIDSTLLVDIANSDAQIGKSDQAADLISDVSEQISYLRNDTVSIEGATFDNGRMLNADNRIPAGYTIYVTGAGDGVSAGTYGTGDKLKFDSSNTTKNFYQLSHFYLIGARAVWESCDMDTYFDGTLIAPASSGFTNTTGDYDKVEIIPSSGLHLFKPVTAGTGAWTGTLTDKIGSSNVLKATPVPVAGNTGWFDYDSDANTLTKNMSQTGGYHLYDFDANLHAFGRYLWGSSETGHQSALDISGVVGKKLFNSWKVKIEFKQDVGALGTHKARVKFIVGSKGNI